MPTKLEDLISQKEAAEMRGVSIQAIHQLIKFGRLKGITVGGKTFVLRKDVENFKPQRTGRPRKNSPANPKTRR